MKKIVIILIVVIVIIIGIIIFEFFYQKSKQSPESSVSQTSSPSPIKEVTIVALGDSLTKAANPSPELIGDHPEYSYSCGDKIESMAKLMEKDGYRVKCYNLASSGAASEEVLSQQVPKAKEYNADYIVMTIGGNDAMQAISSDNLKNNLKQIIASFSDAKILIGNIPNLEEFRKNNYPACETPLSQYRELESLTAVYIISYNLAIKTFGSDRVEIVDLFTLLSKDDVSSYDCLHFSISGQQKTASLFYSEMK